MRSPTLFKRSPTAYASCRAAKKLFPFRMSAPRRNGSAVAAAAAAGAAAAQQERRRGSLHFCPCAEFAVLGISPVSWTPGLTVFTAKGEASWWARVIDRQSKKESISIVACVHEVRVGEKRGRVCFPRRYSSLIIGGSSSQRCRRRAAEANLLGIPPTQPSLMASLFATLVHVAAVR